MLVDDIVNESKWEKFLEYKLNKDFIPKKEKEQLKSFITQKDYLTICKQIADNSYTFSIPQKHLISKGHSGKKRIV